MSLHNTQAASELLHETFSERKGYWYQFLVNNRRADRHPPFRILFEKMAGGVFYSSEELEKFIEGEKSRRLGSMRLNGRAAEVMRAYGIGELGGGITGRKLECSINCQTDAVTGKPYIQFVVKNPLLVFRVEIAQAKAVCRELQESIEACGGHNEG